MNEDQKPDLEDYSVLGKSRWQRNLNRIKTVAKAIKRDKAAVVAISVLSFMMLMALFAPLLTPYDPGTNHQHEDGEYKRLESPSFEHPMGTNTLSQDVFTRWILGSRVSLMVGMISGIVVLGIGLPVGVVSGYYKGNVDLLLMRFVDILFGIPVTPLVLVLTIGLGISVWNIALAFLIIMWRTMARVVRSQTLSISEQSYIKAAKASGASDRRILLTYIIPNLAPLILIEMVFVIGLAILIEAGISFLGYGAVDMISWGTMLQMTFATGAIREAWWWVLPPGLGISAVVISLYYAARALETVTNPEVTNR